MQRLRLERTRSPESSNTSPSHYPYIYANTDCNVHIHIINRGTQGALPSDPPIYPGDAAATWSSRWGLWPSPRRHPAGWAQRPPGQPGGRLDCGLEGMSAPRSLPRLEAATHHSLGSEGQRPLGIEGSGGQRPPSTPILILPWVVKLGRY